LIFVLNSSIWWGKLRWDVFFTLKVSKKTNLSLRRFWISGWFWILCRVFVFLKVINWFNKVPRVFSRCFRPKMGLFIKQTLGLFFQLPQRLDSRDFEMTRRLLIQDDWGSTSLVTFFKNKGTCAWAWPSKLNVGRCSMGLACQAQ